jgi:ribose-phosphate pyrophosphokinase
VTEINTSFTLKTFARLINSLHFDKVVTYDAHSDVSLALIDRIENIDVDTILLRDQSSLYKFISEVLGKSEITIVAPDAGAAKRLTKVIGNTTIDCLTLQKHRNVTNGHITIQSLQSKHDGIAVIIDDICDGGATFMQAAKVLREAGFTEVWLYVTHGIFSKGLHPLFDGGIDKIFTTNSFNSQAINTYKAAYSNHISYKDRVVVDDVI